jgi:hypothetical protein
MKRAGEGILPGGEVVIDGDAAAEGDDHGPLLVALADHGHALRPPVGAVEPERLGDARAGGEKKQNQGRVAPLRERAAGEGEEPLAAVLLERLGEPFGDPGEIDH